jgi:hypothetical protein
MAGRTFFGMMRLAALLAVLAFVALGAWLDRTRSRDWDATLRVTVYPIATADGTGDVRDYVGALDAGAFEDVERFLQEQARAHGVRLEQPVRVRVSHAARTAPPALADDPGVISVMLWSLRMRYWAARVAWNDPLPAPDVQVFALFHAGADATAVPDSVGLSKGLMAVAHLYAGDDAAGGNQIVVVHELLHTLGATDKYDLATGQPLAPSGLGEPDLDPLYPQSAGEIMAGRIAESAAEAVMPDSLDDMLVGPVTAREIGWLR